MAPNSSSKRRKTKGGVGPTGDATQMAMDEDVDATPPTHEAAPAVKAAHLRVGGGRVTVPQHSVAADREAAKGAEDASEIQQEPEGHAECSSAEYCIGKPQYHLV